MTIVLEPIGIRRNGRWEGIHWRMDAGGTSDIEIEHSVEESWAGLLPDPTNADHILPATLLYAMKRGALLDVRGSLSSKLLDGVEHLQEIWNRWRPDRYKKITIKCQSEQQRQPNPGKDGQPKVEGLFAFSGGVDATFTLMRHFYRDAGRQTVKPRAALLIQGFDIPYAADRDYAGAFQRAQRILEECPDVDLIGMRTNSRMLGQDWVDSFGLQLGACFLALQSGFNHAMKGSEEPYDQLIFPWGATPLTIPLISTERLPVTEDGCGYDRSDKVSYISRNTRASAHIRVCWAGNQMDRNCGECEKCIRTMLNYWANGLGVPDSFPRTLTPDLVKTIVLRNEGQAANLVSIRHAASRRDILNTSIGRAIDTVLFRHRLRSLLNAPRSFVSRVKQRIKFHVQSITKR